MVKHIMQELDEEYCKLEEKYKEAGGGIFRTKIHSKIQRRTEVHKRYQNTVHCTITY